MKALNARQAIDADEQQARTKAAKEAALARQAQDATMAALNKKLDSGKIEIERESAALADRLRIAQRKVFALQWQAARQEHEQPDGSSIRFRDYLTAVMGRRN